MASVSEFPCPGRHHSSTVSTDGSGYLGNVCSWQCSVMEKGEEKAEAAQIHAEERAQSKHLLDMGEGCLTGSPLTLIGTAICPTNVSNKTSHPKGYWVF